MHDDLDYRLERLRPHVAEQELLTRRLQLDSKALRAAASAIADQSAGLRLVAHGLARDANPPIHTHPPTE